MRKYQRTHVQQGCLVFETVNMTLFMVFIDFLFIKLLIDPRCLNSVIGIISLFCELISSLSVKSICFNGKANWVFFKKRFKYLILSEPQLDVRYTKGINNFIICIELTTSTWAEIYKETEPLRAENRTLQNSHFVFGIFGNGDTSRSSLTHCTLDCK